MNRRVFTAIRLLLVAVGVTVIVLAVHWRTVMVVPAGEPGLGGQTAEVDRAFVVTSVEPAGPGAVLVHTENGLGGEVAANWIRPGIFDLFASADWWWVLLGLGLVGCIYPLQATRWWLLMRCRGLMAPWPRTLRLVYIGAFSNFFLPGTEGGDVVKAWGATRGSERRVEAVMSVVFDRITGLAGLVLLAAAVGIFAAESNTARDIGWWTAGGMLLIAIVAIGAFFVSTRGWLRMPEVAKTFGGGLPARLFEAGRAYAK
ncbi:MAG: lysylphosphatidylglycerol synthase transmembrane domain-containing protein, partial [Phycisphaerales bacterium]|nr:lysylphosphatidylglycerol synthase transmembrane domain-containing protein [Phycisphaerales bacterium]